MGLPETVTLVEVGLRDGFQNENVVVSTDRKLSIIARLVSAGLRQIQVTSFVHPEKVPQMADADALVRRLPRGDGVVYSALVLNQRGLERAMATGIEAVEISLSASDTHSRKNAGMTHQDALTQGLRMIDRAVSAGFHVRASIQCAFGCVYEGAIPVSRIVDVASRLAGCGVHELSLADTTGMGTPAAVKTTLDAVKSLVGRLPMALHLHDTRGLGLVNLMAGIQHGIELFDTAFAGMGGCPFVSGAAGNIATEDTVHLLDSLMIATGVDYEQVSDISLEMEAIFHKTFPGRMHRVMAHQKSSLR